MITAKAPGRVEILGNHTDYNEGYVLLSTVGLQTTVIGDKQAGNKCSIYSRELKNRVEFQVDSLQKDSRHAWVDYIKGVMQQLAKAGQGIEFHETRVTAGVESYVDTAGITAFQNHVAVQGK